MQLLPKQLISNIGGHYLKNSTSVLFHPTPGEAVDALTKVMSSNFVSFVHLLWTYSYNIFTLELIIWQFFKIIYLGWMYPIQ